MTFLPAFFSFSCSFSCFPSFQLSSFSSLSSSSFLTNWMPDLINPVGLHQVFCNCEMCFALSHIVWIWVEFLLLFLLREFKPLPNWVVHFSIFRNWEFPEEAPGALTMQLGPFLSWFAVYLLSSLPSPLVKSMAGWLTEAHLINCVPKASGIFCLPLLQPQPLLLPFWVGFQFRPLSPSVLCPPPPYGSLFSPTPFLPFEIAQVLRLWTSSDIQVQIFY